MTKITIKIYKKKGIIIPEDITINGNNHIIDGSETAKVFTIPKNSSANYVTIKNLNFKNTNTTDCGSAIESNKIKCTISNCEFNNSYAYGGAISGEDGELNIDNSIFRSNKGYFEGGAIYCENENITIKTSYFINNHAQHTGGVICSKESKLTIKYSIFKNNLCKGEKIENCEGGAIYSTGNLDITYSDFINNNAYDYGGAIYSTEDIKLNDCNFSSNSALDNDGGAIYCEKGLDIVDCYFSNNKAYEDGGAIISRGNMKNIKNSVFEDNTANGAKIAQCEGGAIYADNEKLNVEGCKFTNNMAYDYGGAIWTEKGDITHCSFISNYVSDNDGGAIYYNSAGYVYLNSNNFTDNHADSKGGAIYCDSSMNHISVVSNNFVNNHCDSNKGSAIYTCGDFSFINENWWGTPNPDWDSGLLWENTWYGHIIHYDQSPRMEPI